MSVVEILKFAPTPAYVADRSAGDAGWDYLSKISGVVSIYHGLPEKSKDAYLVVVWRSLDQQKAFLENAEVYSTFRKTVGPAFETRHYLNNVIFSTNPYVPLDAPITEIPLIIMHDDVDVKKYTEKLGELGKLVAGVGKDIGAYGGESGPVIEKERQISGLFGWESVEHFRTAAQKVEGLQELRETLTTGLGTVDLEMVHLKLIKFK